jgi:hypothetical protein
VSSLVHLSEKLPSHGQQAWSPDVPPYHSRCRYVWGGGGRGEGGERERQEDEEVR